MPTSGRVAVGFANAAHCVTHLFMLLYPTAVLGLERGAGSARVPLRAAKVRRVSAGSSDRGTPPHPRPPPACDSVLAASVAAQAAAQVLMFIDRASPDGAVTNGTLELVLPGWQWRRRTWQIHPRCGCGRRGTS